MKYLIGIAFTIGLLFSPTFSFSQNLTAKEIAKADEKKPRRSSAGEMRYDNCETELGKRQMKTWVERDEYFMIYITAPVKAGFYESGQ